eukprot:GILI01026098.1.p1 GENE.GILI01026098.1~~GILI01026098.1.p1  ORF type:complete len:354 (+),score=29.77 GILI01026098.1:43-1062(+)
MMQEPIFDWAHSDDTIIIPCSHSFLRTHFSAPFPDSLKGKLDPMIWSGLISDLNRDLRKRNLFPYLAFLGCLIIAGLLSRSHTGVIVVAFLVSSIFSFALYLIVSKMSWKAVKLRISSINEVYVRLGLGFKLKFSFDEGALVGPPLSLVPGLHAVTSCIIPPKAHIRRRYWVEVHLLQGVGLSVALSNFDVTVDKSNNGYDSYIPPALTMMMERSSVVPSKSKAKSGRKKDRIGSGEVGLAITKEDLQLISEANASSSSSSSSSRLAISKEDLVADPFALSPSSSPFVVNIPPAASSSSPPSSSSSSPTASSLLQPSSSAVDSSSSSYDLSKTDSENAL